jgi:hypothetical protein
MMIRPATARVSKTLWRTTPTVTEGLGRRTFLALANNSVLEKQSQVQVHSLRRPYSSTPILLQASSSPFAGGKKLRKKREFVPRKAAVLLTDKARTFFKSLLSNNPQKAGIMLKYHQSTTGGPRMVFSFDFVSQEELLPEDEGYVDK